jgi:hypothetical protein
MTNGTKQRDTFIAFGDLLKSLALQCRAAERFLRRAKTDRGAPTITAEFAAWVAEREGRVATGLEQCAQQGPENMIARRLQYKPSYRAWLDPGATESALKQVVDLNNAVAEALAEATEKSAPVELGEKMDDLTRQIDAINRKVSLAVVTAKDV